MKDTSGKQGGLNESLAACRSATMDLIRAAQALVKMLDGATANASTLDRAALQLQKVIVDEAHSRFVHSSDLLLRHQEQR